MKKHKISHPYKNSQKSNEKLFSFILGLLLFFDLIVMQLFQEAGNTELRNNLKVNGADHFDSKVTVAQLALIQYGIIGIFAKSFF